MKTLDIQVNKSRKNNIFSIIKETNVTEYIHLVNQQKKIYY